jgi:hypothetical protein
MLFDILLLGQHILFAEKSEKYLTYCRLFYRHHYAMETVTP